MANINIQNLRRSKTISIPLFPTNSRFFLRTVSLINLSVHKAQHDYLNRGNNTKNNAKDWRLTSICTIFGFESLATFVGFLGTGTLGLTGRINMTHSKFLLNFKTKFPSFLCRLQTVYCDCASYGAFIDHASQLWEIELLISQM